MVYKLRVNDSVLEFVRNRGRIFIEADSEADARSAARGVFPEMRDESVRGLGVGLYLVTFWVGLNYKRHLLKQVERAMKVLTTPFKYERARHVDRYMLTTIFLQRGRPDYLRGKVSPREANRLREAAVVAREVNDLAAFIDIDIAIHNYLELNEREGFHSKVVRQPR